MTEIAVEVKGGRKEGREFIFIRNVHPVFFSPFCLLEEKKSVSSDGL